MLELTCAVLLAILPNSKWLASAMLNNAALKVCRTLAKQDVFIKEIWNQHHRNLQDPEWLEDKLSKFTRTVAVSVGTSWWSCWTSSLCLTPPSRANLYIFAFLLMYPYLLGLSWYVLVKFFQLKV
jgi:hypothetical protein